MSKERLIQVQKPAQSLDHFTQSYARSAESGTLLKPILIGAGALVALLVGYGVWELVKDRQVARFESSLAQILLEVEGNDPMKPPTPAELQARMKERLPRLETLAKDAPSARRAVAQGLLTQWKVALEGQGAAPESKDPWARLALADRALALGNGPEAQKQLQGLAPKAVPDTPWADTFWSLQVQADALAGDAAQGRAHLDQYRNLFKGKTNPAILKAAERF